MLRELGILRSTYETPPPIAGMIVLYGATSLHGNLFRSYFCKKCFFKCEITHEVSIYKITNMVNKNCDTTDSFASERKLVINNGLTKGLA